MMIDEHKSVCNHGILHRMNEEIYQCFYCKEEFEADIEIPAFNQQGNIIME